LTAKSADLLRFGIPQDATGFTYIVAYPKVDKSMFAAGTEDGKIYIWDGQTMKLPVRTLISPPSIKGGILSLAWSTDGQWLAASYGDIDVTILIWKI
jgi:eukaryotic-like serine/threonine-protein kinase